MLVSMQSPNKLIKLIDVAIALSTSSLAAHTDLLGESQPVLTWIRPEFSYHMIDFYYPAVQTMRSSGTSSVDKCKHARNDLLLQLKYEVIQREPGEIVCKLTEIFKFRKMQISDILQNKDKIKDAYESNCVTFS